MLHWAPLHFYYHLQEYVKRLGTRERNSSLAINNHAVNFGHVTNYTAYFRFSDFHPRLSSVLSLTMNFATES